MPVVVASSIRMGLAASASRYSVCASAGSVVVIDTAIKNRAR
jgi:hypothetical protein